VYIAPVKRRDLGRKLLALGWTFAREDGNHRGFAKPGRRPLPVPRHAEVNERTALAILRQAEKEDGP